MKAYHTIDLEAPEWTGPYLRPCFIGYGYSEANYPTDDLSRATLVGGAGWIHVLKGSMLVKEARGTFTLKTGQSLLYASPIRASLLFPGPLERLSVGFHGNHSAEIFEHLIRQYGSVHHINSRSPVVQKTRRLFTFARRNHSHPAHVWSVKMYDWMLALWKEFEKKGVCGNPRRHLMRNSQLLGIQHSSFKSFAAAMGYHPAYLSRVIKKSWDNKSPARLLRQGRLREAEELLRTTNLSIREVSNKVCYASPESFSTAFKRFYGHSPLKHRHKYRFGSSEDRNVPSEPPLASH